MNLTGSEEKEEKAGNAGSIAGYSAKSAFSATPVKSLAPQSAGAVTSRDILWGFGLAVSDAFRLTWWNAREGAPVWINHRGAWCAGVVIGRGHRRASVAIETAGSSRRKTLRGATAPAMNCRKCGRLIADDRLHAAIMLDDGRAAFDWNCFDAMLKPGRATKLMRILRAEAERSRSNGGTVVTVRAEECQGEPE